MSEIDRETLTTRSPFKNASGIPAEMEPTKRFVTRCVLGGTKDGAPPPRPIPIPPPGPPRPPGPPCI
jgi:hypothetical protein